MSAMNCALSCRAPIVLVAANLSKGAGTYASGGGLSTSVPVDGAGMESGLAATLVDTGLVVWAKQPAEPQKGRNGEPCPGPDDLHRRCILGYLSGQLFAGRPVTGQPDGYE